jgi:hypothetical protein
MHIPEEEVGGGGGRGGESLCLPHVYSKQTVPLDMDVDDSDWP